jgi:hypothetical protein
MKQTKCLENYPFWIMLFCNLLNFSIYGISIYILNKIGLVWMILYLMFILSSEYRVLNNSCRYCCYYGKYCAFGKGKICSLLFKKGDPEAFITKKITWKSLIPDFLIFFAPLIAGIVILLIRFEWLLFSLLIILFILGTAGNSFIRGKIACKYCKQRKIGCPAEKLFRKNGQ